MLWVDVVSTLHSRSLRRIFPALSLVFVSAGSVSHAADRLPQTPAELMNKRTLGAPGVDVFRVRSSAPGPSHARPAAEPLVALAPPKLPFAYGGSGVVDGEAVLFLDRENRTLLVQVGDVVDGAYRVESLVHNRAVLRYLPLDMPQVLAFGGEGTPEPAPVVVATPQRPRDPLLVNVPDAAPFGKEVPLALAIPPGSPAAKATVELTYDAEALSVLGARVVRPGRALVEVNAQDTTRASQVRLKPIGEETVLTEISIEVTAVDAQGKSVEVRVPSQHFISLVESAN